MHFCMLPAVLLVNTNSPCQVFLCLLSGLKRAGCMGVHIRADAICPTMTHPVRQLSLNVAHCLTIKSFCCPTQCDRGPWCKLRRLKNGLNTYTASLQASTRFTCKCLRNGQVQAHLQGLWRWRSQHSYTWHSIHRPEHGGLESCL